MTRGARDTPRYEVVGRTWEASFSGHCTIEYAHAVRRGDKVSRVRRADNPMLPVPGVACSLCLKMLPRAKV
jgi:hypothetical protein